jgi:hypothetical protein
MVGRRNFDQDYIDACRARSEQQVAIFRWVQAGAQDDEVTRLEDLESEYFNNMLLVLHAYFADLSQTVEGPENGVLKEVRLLATSLMLHGGGLVSDEPDDLDPGQSVLGYESGEPIRLTANQYDRLATRFFTALERTFGGRQGQSD